MPRVFFPVKIDKFDISHAEKFGDIIFLSEDYISPFNINEAIWKFMNTLLKSEFNPEEDYICMTGNSLILCWFSISIITVFEKVKVLLFDSRAGQYQEKILEKPWRKNSDA